jgi:SPP1 family predicted phage head-tail adaptor
MVKCKRIQKTNTKICIGDLNKKISLLTRTLTASPDDSVDFTVGYTTIAEVWSLVQTLSGRDFFDSTQQAGSGATHVFYIRYKAGITQENVIGFGSEYFNITKVWNLEEDSKFLKIDTVIRGSDVEEINLV